jgi:hypothetical protein
MVMRNGDTVAIRFVPPVQGDELCDLMKLAGEESGYVVRDTVHSGRVHLNAMEYAVDAGAEGVAKVAIEVHELTLVSRDMAEGRMSPVPWSQLHFEVVPQKTYDVIRCYFHPMDHNEALGDGADSILKGKPTHLDNFVVALHRLYRGRQRSA